MMRYNPEFKFTEVIVKLHTSIKLSSEEMETEVVGDVIHVGAMAECFKVGDRVLVDKKMGKPLKYLGEDVWRIPREIMVTCGLIENSK